MCDRMFVNNNKILLDYETSLPTSIKSLQKTHTVSEFLVTFPPKEPYQFTIFGDKIWMTTKNEWYLDSCLSRQI